MTMASITEKVNWVHGEITVFTNDTVVSESLRRYGEWARSELNYMLRFIADDSVVMDAGSYIGTHALTFAHKVTIGMVHAFEPNPKSFELLARNIKDSGIKNITARMQAISDKPGTLRFSIGMSDQNFGGTRLEKAADEATQNSVNSIQAISIDDLALERLDFIKIDTEGAEHLAIKGARETIAKCSPFIFAECNSISAGMKTLDALNSLGYQTFGHLCKAYNQDNFNASSENIFRLPSGRDACEVSLIGVHPSRLESATRADPSLVDKRIADADDLALLMLHKPQFPFEVLLKANNFKNLGLPSDLLVKANA